MTTCSRCMPRRVARDLLHDAIQTFLLGLEPDGPDALRRALEAGSARIAARTASTTSDLH